MHYPETLKYFPRNEEWATGDEHLDLKLNHYLLESFRELSSKSISNFFYKALEVKPRVHNPAFQLNIEIVSKALISLLDSQLNVDQEMIKIKGRFADFSLDNDRLELDLEELHKKNYIRFNGSLDIFKRNQEASEQNPFVTHRIQKATVFFDVKPVYKDLIESIEKKTLPEEYSHPLFAKLTQAKIIEVNGLGKIWFFQGRIFCVN